MEEQKRHSGFETMRILSMVMIVLMHGIGHCLLYTSDAADEL